MLQLLHKLFFYLEEFMESVIKVEGLLKEYKELTAVDNLSFEVNEGEILGLLRT